MLYFNNLINIYVLSYKIKNLNLKIINNGMLSKNFYNKFLVILLISDLIDVT